MFLQLPDLLSQSVSLADEVVHVSVDAVVNGLELVACGFSSLETLFEGVDLGKKL